MTAEVHEDKDSQGETTEEEPDFSSEYEPETETDTASESEENSSGNRYIIYQIPCTELLCTCSSNSFQQSYENFLQLRAILLLLTMMYIFYKNLHTHRGNGLHGST